MSEKQKEALDWLDELELYAKEKQLSMRILDSIMECRKNVAADNANWDQINFQIEELLESIAKKTLPSTAQMDDCDNGVSLQAVEDQLKSMLKRCHAENETSVNNTMGRTHIIIDTLFLHLQEITRVKAHWAEMKNEDLFLSFFQRAKKEYQGNVLTLLREILKDVSSNYSNMVERVRSMFQSIGGYKHGIGNEKFYNEYDTKKEGLDNRIRSEIEVWETGGEGIIVLGEETREIIKSIVKKFQRKRKIFAWIPVIVLICILFGSAVSVYIQASTVPESAQEEIEESKTSKEQVVEWITQRIKEQAEQRLSPEDAAQAKEAELWVMRSIVIWVVAIILLIVVAYAFYLLFLKIWCKNQICKHCEKYLKDRLADFKQNNNLLFQMNDIIATSLEEYEQQYVALLNELLAGSCFAPDSQEKQEVNQFASIQNRWSAIKYQ